MSTGPNGAAAGGPPAGGAASPDGGAPADAPLDALLHQVVVCGLTAWSLGTGAMLDGSALGAPGDGADRGGDGGPEAPVRAALTAACVRARAEGLRAEQLLVRLKTAWARAPEAHRPAPWTLRQLAGHAVGPTPSDQLARLVTLCVEEFYRPVPP